MLITAKLLIIEPWEFVSINGDNFFEVHLILKRENQYLLQTKKELVYKGKTVHYLPLYIENNISGMDLWQTDKVDKIRVSLAFIDGLNEENFSTFDFKTVRGNFLTGELTIP